MMNEEGNKMTGATNPLAQASVADIKALVSIGLVNAADALVRVDAVLARSTLTEGKKKRWTRLREWLATQV
jgi:hypothetical protein